MCVCQRSVTRELSNDLIRWVQYLLNIWYRKNLVQSGEEVQHQHPQSTVIFEPKIYWNDILEEEKPHSH